MQVPDDVRTPIPVADHADADGRLPFFSSEGSPQSSVASTSSASAPASQAYGCSSGPPVASLIARNTLAGFPATMVSGGTSRVTTLPAPTMARSPIVTFASTGGAGADRRALLHDRVLDLPIAGGLQLSGRGRRSRIGVVDEHHAVADEDVILDRHALADEGVARDLAPPANAGMPSGSRRTRQSWFRHRSRSRTRLMNLRELDVLPELDVGRNAHEVHGW